MQTNKHPNSHKSKGIRNASKSTTSSSSKTLKPYSSPTNQNTQIP
uniref:Uncharacterized protein n=1 Tax=Rhizophora mucronata TaxID=61149 RepID=A0A2P2J1U6_RHIMU